MVYNFFDKTSVGGDVTHVNKSAIKYISNKQLAEQLHKPLLKKKKKNETYTYLLKIISEVLI